MPKRTFSTDGGTSRISTTTIVDSTRFVPVGLHLWRLGLDQRPDLPARPLPCPSSDGIGTYLGVYSGYVLDDNRDIGRGLAKFAAEIRNGNRILPSVTKT